MNVLRHSRARGHLIGMETWEGGLEMSPCHIRAGLIRAGHLLWMPCSTPPGCQGRLQCSSGNAARPSLCCFLEIGRPPPSASTAAESWCEEGFMPREYPTKKALRMHMWAHARTHAGIPVKHGRLHISVALYGFCAYHQCPRLHSVFHHVCRMHRVWTTVGHLNSLLRTFSHRASSTIFFSHQPI